MGLNAKIWKKLDLGVNYTLAKFDFDQESDPDFSAAYIFDSSFPIGCLIFAAFLLLFFDFVFSVLVFVLLLLSSLRVVLSAALLPEGAPPLPPLAHSLLIIMFFICRHDIEYSTVEFSLFIIYPISFVQTNVYGLD